MDVKEVFADILVIGLSGAFLWHFSNIWRYGEHLVAEPNILIRSLETGALLLIFVFGVSRYINCLRRSRKGK